MLSNDYTTNLLDMEHMEMISSEKSSSEIVIRVQMKRRGEYCPKCGGYTEAVHDYREQTVKDCPVQGKQLIWKYRKRRYRCTCCGKRFYENNWLLPKWHRITNRLALMAVQKLSGKVSRKDIARELGVSESTICRWMNLTEYGKPTKLPTVLSIDEFRGNAGGEKFQGILTSPLEKKIFDILPSCKEREIYEYLHSFSKEERANVKYFISDMKKDYLRIAKQIFPNATLVIDKFHVVRYCTWAVENVRKRVQKELLPEDRKYFKRSRTLLLKHMKDLKDESKLAVERMLMVNTDLNDAYLLKEKFYEFMESKTRDEARKKLKEFRMYAYAADLPEFETLLRVLQNWQEYILNAFDCHYSNGFTEGCNNKIKVLKRIAFGYRNFGNLRQRIMLTVNAPKPTPCRA